VELVLSGPVWSNYTAPWHPWKGLLALAALNHRIQEPEVSPATGLKSGQSNHQETVPFWCSFILN
jgi:hypothetical protein